MGQTSDSPAVSIVMPIRDEARHIGRALDAIDAQTFPRDRIEIIVVDGGSTDGTLDTVRARATRDPRIKLMGGPGVNTPHAMNIGLEAATAGIVAKIDGHGWMNDAYLATAVDAVATDERLGCIGPRVVPEASTTVERAIGHARFSLLGVGGGIYTVDDRTQPADTVQCGVYRKDALLEVGGFDATLPYGEDEEVNHRLRMTGWRIVMNPGMRFTYHVRPSIGSLFRQYFRYGRARVAVIRKHPSFLRPKHLVPAGLVVSLVVSAILAVVVPPNWPFLLVWVAYAATILVGAVLLAIRNRFGRADLIAASLAALHLGYGLGTLRGLFDRRPESTA